MISLITLAIAAIGVALYFGFRATEPDSRATGSASSGLVAVVPEPTSTDANGLPIAPSDPYQPPPGNQPLAGGQSNGEMRSPGPGPSPARPDGWPPSTGPSPYSPPSTPIAPDSTPSVPSGEPIECTVQVGPGPTPGTIRLTVRTKNAVDTVWAAITGPDGERTGAISTYGGYAEQVIAGLSPQTARARIYSSPSMTADSLSCIAG